MAKIGINELIAQSGGKDTQFEVYVGPEELQDGVMWVNPEDMTMNVVLVDEEGRKYLTEDRTEIASEILLVDYMRVEGIQTGTVYLEKSA